MNNKNQDLSRGKTEKSMLDQFLETCELNYVGFSAYLGIHPNTLLQYRKGEREFRLNWEQIRKLDSLLQKIGKRLSDLPSDWIRDISNGNNHEEKTDRTK